MNLNVSISWIRKKNQNDWSDEEWKKLEKMVIRNELALNRLIIPALIDFLINSIRSFRVQRDLSILNPRKVGGKKIGDRKMVEKRIQNPQRRSPG